jgi:hypothetical protein
MASLCPSTETLYVPARIALKVPCADELECLRSTVFAKTHFPRIWRPQSRYEVPKGFQRRSAYVSEIFSAMNGYEGTLPYPTIFYMNTRNLLRDFFSFFFPVADPYKYNF